MPRATEIARGGVKRYRTIRLRGGRYATVAVVRKAGPRGGHTIIGKARKRKGR
jgi:hypothetical protein